MTDQTRYDRTEEEAPLVPLIRGSARQCQRPTPNRQTADQRSIDPRTTDRESTRQATGRETDDRPNPETTLYLARELRTLRTQLDRIEATLQTDK